MEFLVGQLVAPGLVVCPVSIVDENDKLRAEVERLNAVIYNLTPPLPPGLENRALALQVDELRKALDRIAWEDAHRVHAVNPPCGKCPSCIAREALTSTTKQKAESYTMHKISCPSLTGGTCNCQPIVVTEKRTCHCGLEITDAMHICRPPMAVPDRVGGHE